MANDDLRSIPQLESQSIAQSISLKKTLLRGFASALFKSVEYLRAIGESSSVVSRRWHRRDGPVLCSSGGTVDAEK